MRVPSSRHRMVWQPQACSALLQIRERGVDLASLFYGTLWVSLLMLATIYFTSSSASATSAPPRLAKVAPTVAQQDPPAQIAADELPFVHVVPSNDGNEITISLDEEHPLSGLLFANIKDGPTGSKGSWTLPYSNTVGSYIQTIPFSSPTTTAVGRFNLTSTLGLRTEDIRFQRALVQAQPGGNLVSIDDVLKLELLNPGTLTANTYMVVTNNAGEPGARNPIDLTLLSPSYTIRPAGHLVETPNPMTLSISYSTLDLRGADPRTVDIYRWHEGEQQWQPLGATWQATGESFSVGTMLFGTYALAARPRWQADFADLALASLEEQSMVKRGGQPDQWVLMLKQPGRGNALSKAIVPSFGLEAWGTLFFTATTAAPTATLTVDVMSLEGEQLLSNVANGGSLAAIDVAQNPALRLRVNMTTTASTALPTLSSWQVTWQQPLPGLVRVGSGSLAVGGTITVPVELSGAPSAGLGGATVELQYDPALLRASGCAVTLPTALGFCNPAFVAPGGDSTILRFNLLISPAITSAVALAEITFEAVGWAERGVTIEPLVRSALDAQGRPLTLLPQQGLITFTNQPTGDVTCDGITDANDATLILSYIVGLAVESSSCPPPIGTLFLPQCDQSGDGLCDLRDAQQAISQVE